MPAESRNAAIFNGAAWRARVLVALVPALFGLAACDKLDLSGSTSSDNRVYMQPNRAYATVVGRTVQGNGGAGEFVPLAGVTVYAYVEGVKRSTTSDADGFWSMSGIPVTANGLAGSGNTGGMTLTVYFEKSGWLSMSDAVTLAAGDESSQTAMQVDMGPRAMTPLTLRVTASVIHDGTIWLATNGVANTLGRDYLADPAADITLTFNMPVDTAYTLTDMFELLDPAGTPLTFAGSWSSTGLTFTINPTASLTADNNDATRYRIRVRGPIRALNGMTTQSELTNVEIAFNVIGNPHDALLATQAPSLAPQLDNTLVDGSTGRFTGYRFTTAGFTRQRLIDGNNDLVGIPADPNSALNLYAGNPIWISWPAVAGAASYNLYYLNTKTSAANWTRYPGHNGIAAGAANVNGIVVRQVDLSTAIQSAPEGDALLTGGEQVRLLVTAVDRDGVESPLTGVTPLAIADTIAPRILGGVGATTTTRSDATPLSPVSKLNLTVTFNENMDTLGTAQPALAPLSGLLSAIDTASATRSWDSVTTWRASGANLSFRVADTTLSTAANSGDTSLKVTAVGSLMVNDSVLVGDANGYSGPHTINRIASADNRIYLASALSIGFASGTPVRLVSSTSVAGLTYFEPTALTAGTLSGDTTIAVADGSRFYPGMQIQFWKQDENGYSNAAAQSPTIASVAGNTITLTQPLGSAVNSPAYNAGTLIRWILAPAPAAAGLPVQPQPRAPFTATLANDIQFNTNAVVTSLAAASQYNDAQPPWIVVADATGLAIGDWITIAASSAASTLAADLTNAAVVIPVFAGTGGNFQVGDVLRIAGETVNASTGASVAAAATSLPVTPAFAVQAGETLTITEDRVFAYTTSIAAAGATTLTLTSTTGLAIGQTITISDNQAADEGATISGIAGNQITLGAGLANARGAGTVINRAPIITTATVQTSTSVSPITVTAGLPALSAFARIRVVRASENVTVTGIAADNLTVVRGAAPPPPASNFHRSTSPIALVSEPETRQIVAFWNGTFNNAFVLNAGLGFMHRQNAAVTKQPQGVMTLTGLVDRIVLGDTVVIDTLSPATFPLTLEDRFEATVTAIDTANNQVTVTATSPRARVDYSTAGVLFMGDAAAVSVAQDTNGNVVNSSVGYRVNLSNGTAR